MLFKGFFDYVSPRGPSDEIRRSEREYSPTQSPKREAGLSEMAETKKLKVPEPITAAADTREKTSPKERSSMDSRRKDSVRGEEKWPPTSKVHTQLVWLTSRIHMPRRVGFTTTTAVRTATSSVRTTGATSDTAAKSRHR